MASLDNAVVHELDLLLWGIGQKFVHPLIILPLSTTSCTCGEKIGIFP